MIQILSALLTVALISKIVPPKKITSLYGYQLGNAKKSIQHWKIANKHASNYMIITYSFLILLSLLFDYIKYDGDILCFILLLLAFITIYFLIERKLKQIII